jgi:hypothetical protein
VARILDQDRINREHQQMRRTGSHPARREGQMHWLELCHGKKKQRMRDKMTRKTKELDHVRFWVLSQSVIGYLFIWRLWLAVLVVQNDNKRTGTTIKVSDGIRSERAFDLQKGDEGHRVSRLTSRGETTRRTTVFVLTY